MHNKLNHLVKAQSNAKILLLTVREMQNALYKIVEYYHVHWFGCCNDTTSHEHRGCRVKMSLPKFSWRAHSSWELHVH